MLLTVTVLLSVHTIVIEQDSGSQSLLVIKRTIDPSILFVVSVSLMPSFIPTIDFFSKMRNQQFTVSESMPSTENIVFQSNAQ